METAISEETWSESFFLGFGAANDDGGVSPFPQLVDLEPHVLEYCLQYRDRFIAKAGNPVAVLEEFWAEQKGLEDGRLATLGMFAEKRAVKL